MSESLFSNDLSLAKRGSVGASEIRSLIATPVKRISVMDYLQSLSSHNSPEISRKGTQSTASSRDSGFNEIQAAM